MKKREDIIEKFSTFLNFGNSDSDRNPIWQTDPELERCIRSLVASEPQASEEFWARYFLKVIQQRKEEANKWTGEELEPLTNWGFRVKGNSSISSSIASRHVSAYLQEACLWASQKVYQKFKYLRHKYPLEEYFQIANSAANPPAKLLKNFNFEHPLTNIEGYAKTAIMRLVGNTIYQHDIEAKRSKFSDYGLLKNLNAKELKEALTARGINNKTVEHYCLVWQCLDKIYQPQLTKANRSLEPPNQQHLQEMASCYNQQINKLGLATAPVSSHKIQEILLTCIQAARDYRTQRFLPLEEYENISEPIPTAWDNLMQEESWQEIQMLISKLFVNLPESGQTMLKLWHGLNLTQIEIVALLQVKQPELQKQYQVARHLGRHIRNLLKNLAIEWNQINPGNQIQNEKHIEIIKDAMNECLQSYCQKLLYSILEQIVEMYQDAKQFLSLDTEIHTPRQTENKQKYLAYSETYNLLKKSKQDLIITFQKELENSMQLTPNSLDIVNNKISNFVDGWLHSKLYSAQ